MFHAYIYSGNAALLFSWVFLENSLKEASWDIVKLEIFFVTNSLVNNVYEEKCLLSYS